MQPLRDKGEPQGVYWLRPPNKHVSVEKLWSIFSLKLL